MEEALSSCDALMRASGDGWRGVKSEKHVVVRSKYGPADNSKSENRFAEIVAVFQKIKN